MHSDDDVVVGSCLCEGGGRDDTSGVGRDRDGDSEICDNWNPCVASGLTRAIATAAAAVTAVVGRLLVVIVLWRLVEETSIINAKMTKAFSGGGNNFWGTLQLRGEACDRQDRNDAMTTAVNRHRQPRIYRIVTSLPVNQLSYLLEEDFLITDFLISDTSPLASACLSLRR